MFQVKCLGKNKLTEKIQKLWEEGEDNNLADDLWVKEVQRMLPKGSKIIQVNAGVDEVTGETFVQYHYNNKDGNNVLKLKL